MGCYGTTPPLILPVTYKSTDATPVTFPYTIPNGPTTLNFKLIGGGGGGGASTEDIGGSGGGGGGYIEASDLPIQPGETLTFTLGSGGAPSSSGGSTILIYSAPPGINVTYTLEANGGGGGAGSGGSFGGYSTGDFPGATGYNGDGGEDGGGNDGGYGGAPYNGEGDGKGIGGNGGSNNQSGQSGQPGYWEFTLSD